MVWKHQCYEAREAHTSGGVDHRGGSPVLCSPITTQCPFASMSFAKASMSSTLQAVSCTTVEDLGTLRHEFCCLQAPLYAETTRDEQHTMCGNNGGGWVLSAFGDSVMRPMSYLLVRSVCPISCYRT